MATPPDDILAWQQSHDLYTHYVGGSINTMVYTYRQGQQNKQFSKLICAMQDRVSD